MMFKLITALILAFTSLIFYYFTAHDYERLKESNNISDDIHLNSNQVKSKSYIFIEPSVINEVCEPVNASGDKFNKIIAENRHIQTEIKTVFEQIDNIYLRNYLLKYGLSESDVFNEKIGEAPPIGAKKQNSSELAPFLPFLRLLKAKKYNEIADLVQTGIIEKNATIHGQYLVTWIIELEGMIPPQSIVRLLDAGLMIDLDTLYVAIQAGVDKNYFEILLQYLQNYDLTKIWVSERENFSLATYAAKYRNFDTANFLWKNGSPLFDSKLGLNVATQIPWQSLTRKELSDALKLLFETLGRPIQVYNDQYLSIEKLLDKNEISQFEAIEIKSDKIFYDLEKFNPLIDEIVKNKKSLDLITKCHPSLLDKLKYIKTSRDGKLYSHSIRKFYYEELKADDPNNAIYTEIENALAIKDWQKILQLLNNLTPADAHSDLYAKVYYSMLESKVNYSIYEEFVGFYSIVPDYLFLGASLYGNNRLASLLISRGADIHVRDKNGFSALQIAVLNSSSEGNLMIEYLLSLGVRIDEGNGPDAFSLLLSQSHEFNIVEFKNYVELFKSHGLNNLANYHKHIDGNKKITEEEKEIIKSWL